MVGETLKRHREIVFNRFYANTVQLASLKWEIDAGTGSQGFRGISRIREMDRPGAASRNWSGKVPVGLADDSDAPLAGVMVSIPACMRSWGFVSRSLQHSIEAIFGLD